MAEPKELVNMSDYEEMLREAWMYKEPLVCTICGTISGPWPTCPEHDDEYVAILGKDEDANARIIHAANQLQNQLQSE